MAKVRRKDDSSSLTKEEIFEAAFDLWLTDYRIMAWEDLTTDEIKCLCDYHRRDFLKRIKECKNL